MYRSSWFIYIKPLGMQVAELYISFRVNLGRLYTLAFIQLIISETLMAALSEEFYDKVGNI